MKIIQGGVAAAKGFWAGGIHCGIKYKNKDLALIYSEVPCVACGLFTQNKVQAAPVKLSRAHLKNNKAQAIVINSGCANCCTGKQGIQDAREICASVAEKLGIEYVLNTLPKEASQPDVEKLIKELNNDGNVSAIMVNDLKFTGLTKCMKAPNSKLLLSDSLDLSEVNMATGISHIFAARSRITSMASRAAKMVVMPEEKVPRLPSVVSL